MSPALAFWIVALVALVFGGWGFRGGLWQGAWSVVFFLVLLMGWQVFGAPIHH